MADTEFKLPDPEAIKRRNLDTREATYVKAPVGGQINLQGDSQVGLSGATVGIMSNVQQFIGNTGTFFSKGQQPTSNFTTIDINNFSCDCGGKNTFKVTQNIPEYRAKVVKCISCGAVYGLIPSNIYDIVSSPAAGSMTQGEIARVILRQSKTSQYVLFQKGG